MPREHVGGKTIMHARNNIERQNELYARASILVKGRGPDGPSKRG